MAFKEKKGIIAAVSAFLDKTLSNKTLNPGLCRFSDYSSSDKLLRNSRFWGLFNSKKNQKIFLGFRTGFARQCENSVILRFLYGFPSGFASSSAKSLASFFITYSLTAAATLFVHSYLNDSALAYSQLIYAGLLILFSLPLMFTDSSVYRQLCSGFFLKSFLFDTLLMPKSENADKSHPGMISVWVFICGIFFGLCVRHINILVIPAAFLILLFLFIILLYPEAGFGLLVFCAPLLSFSSYSSLLLGSLVCFVIISYLFKLFRGRRTVKMTCETLVFFLLTFGMLLSSVSGTLSSLKAALLSAVMMSGYFLSLNLFRNENHLVRISALLSLSASIVSAYGIIQYILGTVPLSWLDFSLFTEISGRCISFFDNPNMLGAYLTLIFPFSLQLMTGNEKGLRFAGTVSSLLTVACAILTWSRGCWIGMLVGFILYFLFLTPRSVLLIPVTALSCTALGFIFPDTVGLRLLNFFSMSDSTNRYRVKVWQGSFSALKDYFFCGIGSGDMAFRSVYLNYSAAAAGKAVHSHSLYIQLCLSCGIVVLILFCIFIFLLMKKTLNCSGTVVKSSSAKISFAAFSSLAALCVCGIFDNVFYNYRVMFMFFCICGICSVASRLASDSIVTNDTASPESIDVTITF